MRQRNELRAGLNEIENFAAGRFGGAKARTCLRGAVLARAWRLELKTGRALARRQALAANCFLMADECMGWGGWSGLDGKTALSLPDFLTHSPPHQRGRRSTVADLQRFSFIITEYDLVITKTKTHGWRLLSSRGMSSPRPSRLQAETARDLQPIDFDGEVNLFHFVLLRSVGKGAFGKVRELNSPSCLRTRRFSPQVRVVQHKQTRELYALKYINKAKCVKMKAVANIIQERRLLEEVCVLPKLLCIVSPH
jgi:hypothetical protein